MAEMDHSSADGARVVSMEEWQLSYLGLRFFPEQFSSRDLTAFFSFSTEDQAFINLHRPAYRVAIAVLLGFLRMTGCLPDHSAEIPPCLKRQLAHLNVDSSTRYSSVGSFYASRPRTLAEHQVAIRRFAGWSLMKGPCIEEVLQWLKQDLSTEPGSSTLLKRLRVCLYECRLQIVSERKLRLLIARAAREVKMAWHSDLAHAYGQVALDRWNCAIARAMEAPYNPQQLYRIIALGRSTFPIGTLLSIIESLYAFGIQRGWPPTCHPIMVRYYAERYAQRAEKKSLLDGTNRALEAVCFLRHVLYCTTDQLVQQLCKWIAHALATAERDVDASPPNFQKPAREFARLVMTLTDDPDKSAVEVCRQLHILAQTQLESLTSTRAGRVRTCLVSRGMQARVVLVRLAQLAFDAPEPHPVINALQTLRKVYTSQPHIMPYNVNLRFKREWQPLVNSDDRQQALHAFEWATLLALRSALLKHSVRVEHSAGL